MPYTPPPDTFATQHDGTEGLAIHNTFLRRMRTLLEVKTTTRLLRRRWNGPCLRLSKKRIVKTDVFVHLTEGATMQYVADHTTSIPVPRVYCSFVHRNRAYLVMERIDGVTVAEAWPTLSDDDRKVVCAQLRTMLDELRSLQAPEGVVGVQSCCGGRGGDGSLQDSRIPDSRPRFGPFATMEAFHLWLREGLRPEEHKNKEQHTCTDDEWRDIEAMAAKQDALCSAPPVFTHGDLNPANILVRGNKVVGIIDWEFSGWYPYYWEYTSAWYGNRTRESWQNTLDQFLDVYPEELEMEITRQKWWGID